MHHHFDLLNWDRRRLVYGAWLMGAVLGVLGVASVVGQFTWERYLARLVGLGVVLSLWQLGPRTRSFFIGLNSAKETPEGAPRRLALYYGYPFKLFGRRLCGRIDVTQITAEVLESPGEQLTLWQRMSVFDARSLLGFYCYRAGDYEDALRIWERIPEGNLELRPQIAERLAEVRHRVALEQAGMPDAEHAHATVTAESGSRWASALADDPSGSQWRMTNSAASGTSNPPRLEPASFGFAPPDAPTTTSPPHLWSASAWSAATSGILPLAEEEPPTTDSDADPVE
jgi:hypothetical protein